MSSDIELKPPIVGVTLTRFAGPEGRRRSYQITGPDGYVQLTYDELMTIASAAIHPGLGIVHPSLIRDRLWNLGYVLVDVRGSGGSVTSDQILTTSAADDALHLALTGGEEYERKVKEHKPTTTPMREVIFAEEVEGSNHSSWLVTLLCGHKKAVNDKRNEYPCLECLAKERK